jgi:uncharacterized membrane protein
MKPKPLGIIILITSFIVVVILIQFNSTLNTQNLNTCNELCNVKEGSSCSLDSCPFNNGGAKSNSLILIMGLLVAFVGGIGFYLSFTKAEKLVEEKVYDLTKLSKEEKEVFLMIKKDGNGGVYQSRIIEQFNFPKTKVTRILDKLEQRQLIERKRRGMTNIIVVK